MPARLTAPTRARARARSKRRTWCSLHCNSFADGYWTDISRTYVMGDPNDRQAEMYDTIFAARTAALRAVAPGVHAAEIDRAAREVLERRDFGKQFRHPTGHGVGFAAIDHHARPRLHPKSPDILEAGMVFNIEPGIYVEDWGGMRHCDVVALTENGADVLTPFQCELEELVR